MKLRILSDELEEIQVPWVVLSRIWLVAFLGSFCVEPNVVEFGLSIIKMILWRS